MEKKFDRAEWHANVFRPALEAGPAKMAMVIQSLRWDWKYRWEYDSASRIEISDALDRAKDALCEMCLDEVSDTLAGYAGVAEHTVHLVADICDVRSSGAGGRVRLVNGKLYEVSSRPDGPIRVEEIQEIEAQ